MSKTWIVIILGALVLVGKIGSQSSQIDVLNAELQACRAEARDAAKEINRQNEAVKRLEIDLNTAKQIEAEAKAHEAKIDKIVVKDGTCGAELKAFKELFNE